MNSLLTHELKNAFSGILAVLLGKKNAGDYFDLGLRGLAGSLVVFLIAAAFNAYLPGIIATGTELSADAPPPPTAAMALFLVTIVYIFQSAFGAIALNQFKKLDGLVPYLVVSNWATFFFTGLFAALRLVGLNGFPFLLLMATMLIVSEINILRLVIGLKFAQIAMFIIAQFIGALGGLMIFWIINPSQI